VQAAHLVGIGGCAQIVEFALARIPARVPLDVSVILLEELVPAVMRVINQKAFTSEGRGVTE
jgi:hypothetical protein